MISELEGSIPISMLNYATPEQQEIDNMFDTSLEYFDRQEMSERDMIIEDRKPDKFLRVYAWPCRFVISFFVDEKLQKNQEICTTVTSQLKSISHHYGDYFQIYVAEKFSQELVQSSKINSAALLTWGDYQRFLDFGHFPHLARKAPTVSEWSRLFETKGIGSYTVFDIIKERCNEKHNTGK